MVVNIIVSMFKMIATLAFYPVCACIILVVLFLILRTFWMLRFRAQGKKPLPTDNRKWTEPRLWKRLLVLTPRRAALDRIERPPNYFPVSGLIIFEGMQGSGKTSSMVHELRKLQYSYPHLKVITNFGYTAQDTELSHWSQLVNYKNGFEGVAAALDELQNWFSSRQSANFPPEMLSVVTQNRKNRRVIFGTAQNFYMLAKDIRTQCTELRRCSTLLGCLTIVHRVRPICDSQGEVVKFKHIGFYCWVHEAADRDSYDTYKAIQALSDAGFKDPLTRSRFVKSD